MIRLDISTEVIDFVAWRMAGGAGPGGVDYIQIRICILCYSNTSIDMREAYVILVSLIAKSSPP